MPTRKLQFTFFPLIYVVLVALALVLALPARAVTTAQDVTLHVSGSTNRTVTMLSGSTYDTLTIQDSGFQFTLSGSESLTLRSNTKDIMTNTFSVGVSCGDSSSDLVLPASKGSTVGITLAGVACSGGGGGGSNPPPPPSPSPSGGGGTSPSPSPASVPTPATAPTNTPSATPPPAPSPSSAQSTTPSSTSSAPLSNPLKPGLKGEDVMALQRFLQANGFIPSTVKLTGYYGPATTKAVKLFQAKHKLPQVGQVGPMTLKALNAEMSGMPSANTPAPSPAPASPVTGTTAADIQKKITDLTALINSLQAQIKARQ